MFLLLLTYLGSLTEIDDLMAEHRAYLDRHYATGAFLMSGPRVPRSGGMILAAAESRELVEAMIAEDPFVKHGVARYDIVEFRVTRHAEPHALALALADGASTPR